MMEILELQYYSSNQSRRMTGHLKFKASDAKYFELFVYMRSGSLSLYSPTFHERSLFHLLFIQGRMLLV